MNKKGIIKKIKERSNKYIIRIKEKIYYIWWY